MNTSDTTLLALNEELPDGHIPTGARALPVGARLGEFEIEEILREGGVSVVYAATDRSLDVPVAISEYMPARLAQRGDAGQIAPRTPAQSGAFAYGLAAFIDETRTLARCDHPSLARVLRLWESHGTAYRVMPRYPAWCLLDLRRSMSEPPDEHALRAVLDPLLGALEAFHDAAGGHGKVTPSNILLLDSARPLLLGPGAAARAIASDRIDVVMTSAEPCFAPIEQIVETDGPLHPSVDLYALAGVARYLISGQLPAPSLGALEVARPERLAETVHRLCLTWPQLHYSESLLNALDSALSIYPAERPQSVAEMRARLDVAPPVAVSPVGAPEHAAPVPDDEAPSSPAAPGESTAQVEQEALVTAPAPDFDVEHASVYADLDDDVRVRVATARQPKPRRIVMWSGVLVALLALGLVALEESGQQRHLARALQTLGISRGTASDAPVSASGERPGAPTSPPITANAGAANLETSNGAVANAVTTNAATDAATVMPPSTTAGPTEPSVETTSPAPRASTPSEASAAAVASASVVQPPVPTPSPAHAVEQNAVPGTPTSPREACGTRTQFSLYRCMQTQCSQPQWASHAQCEHLRATDTAE